MDNDAPLESRIAEAARLGVEDVRDVFAEYGIPLVTAPARPRRLRVHRLRVAGERTGAVYPGPFDSTLNFAAGLTALVAANLRGKTSVLELLSLCLRGTPRDVLTVRHWLREVDLDLDVAGQALGVRLGLAAEEIVSAVVLAAPTVDVLRGHRDADVGAGIQPVFRAASTESYVEQICALMMDRLDLHPLVNSYRETGTQTHGWPAYFGALYLPAGRDKALLGDQMMSGLPGRLLQVFLDLPSAAALTRVKTAAEVLSKKRKAAKDASTEAQEQRIAQRREIETSLNAARAREAALRSGGAGDEPTLGSLAAQTMALARRVADQQVEWNELMQVHRQAQLRRQQDQKALNDVTESATARALFHGLDPKACPRCDQGIAADRRQREAEAQTCAVCDRHVVVDDESPEEIVAEAKQRLEDSSAAAGIAKTAMEEAESALSSLSVELDSAEAQLRQAESATQVASRVEVREEVLRLEGALSVYPDLPEFIEDPTVVRAAVIFRAAVRLLERGHETAAATLFADLNTEIVTLGKRFGIDSLESVSIDRAAHLNVTKDGDNVKPFGKQSPGERLRLRIAVVIALLRVGAAHHVATHPGLILIDSPKAEEVQDLDIRALLKELASAASEADLQVLITTGDSRLAHDVLPPGQIIEASDGQPLW